MQGFQGFQGLLGFAKVSKFLFTAIVSLVFVIYNIFYKDGQFQAPEVQCFLMLNWSEIKKVEGLSWGIQRLEIKEFK